jgi:nucleotide-binding universal stress UspA family protein
VRPALREGAVMFKRILVPTDGSEFSQETIRRAVTLAREAGASICAFYAKPQYPRSYYSEGVVFDSSPPGRFEELAEQEGQEIVGFVEGLCRQAGVPCSNLIVASEVVYKAIIEAATQNDCDLIFMASHGRRGLSALVLGSETQKVLTHSKIPVLVYR